jgi:hypothetical protein
VDSGGGMHVGAVSCGVRAVVLVVMLGVVASLVHSGEGGGLLVCVVGSGDDGVRLWSCYRHRRRLRGF